ncbi:MAG: hypothetical protein HY695_12085 [Deltaproteobacteria bacterium]|nr:hypothetical protein [Deltaproteobacteria bacterium]
MKEIDLAQGQVVLWEVTTARRYLAIVRRVDSEFAELDFFWGGRKSVRTVELRPFVAYLDERDKNSRRVFSVKRSTLCEMFFNRPLRRLRPKPARTIRNALRKHGLRYDPEEWPKPDTRVRIWRDCSFVSVKASTVDSTIEALLPRWLEPERLPPSSRDPLGLQAYAERLANALLPGLTVFTTRAGYYGFLAWAIQLLNGPSFSSGPTRRERLNRLERGLVLCEFIQHDINDNSCALLGQRSKTQLLQGHEANRYRVPTRILKNQNSAGAFRLYATSLTSFGFAVDAPDLGADRLLPYSLSDFGERLARGFKRRVPDAFTNFALGDETRHRDVLREWGGQLCFSELRLLEQYRRAFLEGFILGNSVDAERRFLTVRRLFQRGLLTERYEKRGQIAPEATAEDDSAAAEEAPELEGLSNDRVLLYFYDQAPTNDNRDFQTAAVFELLGLGLSAIFRVLVEDLRSHGRTRTSELGDRIMRDADARTRRLWSAPLAGAAAGAPTVRTLVPDLFRVEGAAQCAAVGGLLLARLVGERMFRAVAPNLTGSAPLILVDSVLRSQPERSLAQALPELLQAMVERHGEVSVNKGRQRWCYFDGEAVVKDDLQEMALGFHSMRFPQLYSLCRDVRLGAEDLRNGN